MPYKSGKRTGNKKQKMVTRTITAAAKAKGKKNGLTGTPRYGRNYPDGVNDAPKLPGREKRVAGRDF